MYLAGVGSLLVQGYWSKLSDGKVQKKISRPWWLIQTNILSSLFIFNNKSGLKKISRGHRTYIYDITKKMPAKKIHILYLIRSHLQFIHCTSVKIEKL